MATQLLLTGGAAAEFKKMSGLSGIKSTPLCLEKEGTWLERIMFFYCEHIFVQELAFISFEGEKNNT